MTIGQPLREFDVDWRWIKEFEDRYECPVDVLPSRQWDAIVKRNR